MRTPKAVPIVLRRRGHRVEVLVFAHPEAGTQIVKGTVEPGESVAQAAERELMEEAGIDGSCHRDLGTWEHGPPGQVWHFREMAVRNDLPDAWDHFTADGGGLRFKFAWHALDAPSPADCHPVFVHALAFLRERLTHSRNPKPPMDLPIIENSPEAEAQLNAFLDDLIYEFNIAATGFHDGRPFAGVVKDEAGAITAAINGHTWGGCCYVAHLWVADSQRRKGLGSALLRSTENEARARGCAQVLLMTHSFQAPEFYERLGYIRQATIADYPRGHAQLAYVKRLGPQPEEPR